MASKQAEFQGGAESSANRELRERVISPGLLLLLIHCGD